MSMTTYLASDYPLEHMVYPTDGDWDFTIWPLDDRAWDIYSDKPYRAEIQWDCTPDRAKHVLHYIRQHLKTAPEVELWHGWRGGDIPKIIRYEAILDTFTWEDIAEIDSLPVLSDPPVYHCVLIRRE